MSNKSNPTRTLYSRPDFLAAMDDAEAEHAAMKQKTSHRGNGSESAAQTPQGQVDSNPDEGKPATSDEDLTYKERWKQSKKYYDTEIHKARQRIQELEAQGTPQFSPPKTQEEMEKFKTEYADFYDAMITVNSQGNELTSKLANEVNELKQKLSETEVEKALRLIEERHPDFKEIVSDDAFTAWLDTQTPDIRSWVENNQSNASTFNRALDLYKMDTGVASKQRSPKPTKSRVPAKASAADAVHVKGSGKVSVGDTTDRIWTREEIGKMHPDQYSKHMAEIDKALQEGRVI